MPTQLPAPIPSGIWPGPGDADLTAPLELPAVAGKPLTTGGGSTLDDGSGNVIVAGHLSNTYTYSSDYMQTYNLYTSGSLVPTGTTPALGTNPPVSGTVYQNVATGILVLTIPITASAAGGSGQWALGPTDTPPDWGGADQIGVLGEVHNMMLVVPPNWYWSLTVTSATIGTASALAM